MLTFQALVPVTSWIFLNAATGLLLTVPLRYRLYGLPAVLIPATISFRTLQHLKFLPGLSELWGSITLITLIHFTSLLYMKKWTLCTLQRTGKASGETQFWLSRNSCTSMYKVASNPRFVRVPYKHVVPVKHRQHIDVQVKTTAIHRRFSMTRVLWLLFKVGLHFLLNRLTTTRLLGAIRITEFTPAKAVLFRRLLGSSIYHEIDPISIREIVLPIWFTMNTIWTPVILLDGLHIALAVFFIHIIRIDTPDEWPDLFGSPLEAYTLSRFWTSFWHRCHLSGYSDYANLLISMLPHCILQNATTKRLLMIFLLFSFSGLVHQLTSWQLNPGCIDFADFQFFAANGAVVILESALLKRIVPSRWTSDTGKIYAQRRTRNVLARFVGYTWVISFFVWAVPKFYYPRIYCAIQQLRVGE